MSARGSLFGGSRSESEHLAVKSKVWLHKTIKLSVLIPKRFIKPCDTFSWQRQHLPWGGVKVQSIKTDLKGFGDKSRNGALRSVDKIIFCLQSLCQMAAIKRESALLFIVFELWALCEPPEPPVSWLM